MVGSSLSTSNAASMDDAAPSSIFVGKWKLCVGPALVDPIIKGIGAQKKRKKWSQGQNTKKQLRFGL